ncbi:MAG: hypothetical protein BGO39_11230 [Chloroflexi bacterium 54-19]|nr:MAG: hypothetical protein BGO39_11230 [Chloroflexi bacterium 54-19]
MPAAPTGPFSDLTYLSVAEASNLIEARKLSPVELTNAAIKRIEQLEPQLQAFATQTTEQALAAARLTEQEIMAGARRGPLHGIPLVLKDLIETKGIRTTASSKVLADYIPTKTSTVARKLEEAGTILMGKVHTHEFAYGVVCPPTRNPWNLDCIPGGSSGGSAAAVASGMATLAIGTDTAGSIRIPAALCGTVGLKPTYGRVSRQGVLPLSWSLDHVGPICRTVEDAALLLQAIAGYDAQDPASAIAAVPDYLAGLKENIKGLKIGIVGGSYFELVTPGLKEALEIASTILGELGAVLEHVEIPDVEESDPVVNAITLAEASTYHQKWLRDKGHLYNPDVLALLQIGELLLATDFVQAKRRRRLLAQKMLDLFQVHHLDVLMLPTVVGPAPQADEPSFKMGEVELPVTALLRYTCPFNATGLPALAVPCGFENGLPLSMQLVGKPFDEATLLRVGYNYEQATPWHHRHPQYPAKG